MATAKHFDISQLPSLKDGMSVQEEALTRRKTCRFIAEAGRVLRLPPLTVATAMVLFHRFYAKYSFKKHDRFEVACAAILLAGKTEESPKKLNVIIDEAYKLKARAMTGSKGLDPKSEEFAKVKERVLLLERLILHTIGFELSIDHPYKFLGDIINDLVQKKEIEFNDPSSESSSAEAMKPMMQHSMSSARDSMQTSLCLQFDPQKIATACVYLAGNFAKIQPTNKKSWLEVLGHPDAEALASISLQILELMQDRKGTDTETIAKLRREIEQMKEDDGAPEPDQKRPRTC